MNVRLRGRGFTLVELLVVIAIIGILIALMLPAVQSAREAARRLQCQNHLKQLGVAVLNYESSHQILPPSATFPVLPPDVDTTTVHWRNWVIMILPFIEQEALHDSFNFSVPISDAANRQQRGTPLAAMLCPSDGGSKREPFGSSGEGDNWARGNYGANGSLGAYHTSWRPAAGPTAPRWNDRWSRGVMGVNASVTMGDIKDGTSQTIMLEELRTGLAAADRRGVWALSGPGSSSVWMHGSDDAVGPNCCAGASDNIAGCGDIIAAVGQDTLDRECMTCCNGCSSTQAGPRSQHVEGIYVCMCDGSVRFISRFVEMGTSWDIDPNDFLTWQRLNASADRLTIDTEY
jgi:prepilin-type N-terminal cleavage/methylation domain-containing protein